LATRRARLWVRSVTADDVVGGRGRLGQGTAGDPATRSPIQGDRPARGHRSIASRWEEAS